MKRFSFLLLFAWDVVLLVLNQNQATGPVTDEEGELLIRAHVSMRGTPDDTPNYFTGMDEIYAVKKAAVIGFGYSGFGFDDAFIDSKSKYF